VERELPYLGSVLISLGIAIGRWANGCVEWLPPLAEYIGLALFLSILLECGGAALWFVHLFQLGGDEKGKDLLGSFALFVLLSYILFSILG